MRTQDKKEKELEIEMIRLSFHQSSARHDHFTEGSAFAEGVFSSFDSFQFLRNKKGEQADVHPCFITRSSSWAEAAVFFSL